MDLSAQSQKRIHPLVATAAIAVTIVSLAGAAAITGLLPSSHSSDGPAGTSADASATPNKLASNLAPVVPAPEPAPAAPVVRHDAAPVAHVHTAPRLAQPMGTVHTAAICSTCGQVESVQAIEHKPEQTSGLGVAAGAVLGGLLGHQVGGGNGKTLATVAGAVGGGLAGNAVESRTRTTTTYQVHVRMEDGSVRNFPYSAAPGFGAGDHVKVVNGQLTARG
jgi:outer membrane lipoprotein SlyB